MGETRVCYIDIPGSEVHHKDMSLSPSPRFERNMGFFHTLSRRFRLRSNDDLLSSNEEDSRSSSTDSCSSTNGPLPSNNVVHSSNLELSCGSSDSSSSADITEKSSRSSLSAVHRRSTSSIRRAFENISISSSRSLSCSSTPSKESIKQSKKSANKTPQRILRQPVSYTYLKGMSGLPTQRVPRSAVCCQYNRR